MVRLSNNYYQYPIICIIINKPGLSGKGVVLVKIIKYIEYKDRRVYAIYYPVSKTMYYNLNFAGRTKIYFLIW